ncbi:MAG: hypothetical protein KDD44_05460, partial [Bdellovibrionales bacterium]|nr:hypothetical protein [Bdellovibrionales bacterium]
DDEEIELGTDPEKADTDNDGVSDGQELIDSSDPLDPGSVLLTLPSSICTEWNGFLGTESNPGMYNILENLNNSGSTLSATASLYDNSGELQSSLGFSVASGAQQDLLVHDMGGFLPDTIGQVCVNHSGNAGDLDGRMVLYQPSLTPGAASDEFQFAYAMPYGAGLPGDQYVPFNTANPSLNTADYGNLVANWIQITNRTGNTQNGTLRFYGMSGELLGSTALSIPASARSDVSGHQWGPWQVGLVAWEPVDQSAMFTLRNVRYFYDNPGSVASFITAFQLTGAKGSGQELIAALDTSTGSSIVEMMNVSSASITVAIAIYNQSGILVSQTSRDIGPKASYHLITDSILDGQKGTVKLASNVNGSLLAVVMQYGRDDAGSLQYLFGHHAAEPLGVVFRSSYNTFLSQGCRLTVANASPTSQLVTFSLTRWDGTVVASGITRTIAGNGLLDENLCMYETTNQYGVVTVQGTNPNSLYGFVRRIGKNNQYHFPTALRQ